MLKNSNTLNTIYGGGSDEPLRNRFRGALIGTMVGDALGMPVEGYSSSAIKHTVGEVRDSLEKGRDYVFYLADCLCDIALT